MPVSSPWDCFKVRFVMYDGPDAEYFVLAPCPVEAEIAASRQFRRDKPWHEHKADRRRGTRVEQVPHPGPGVPVLEAKPLVPRAN